MITIVFIALPTVLFGQKLNHRIDLNIDSDNKIEHLLFYDSFDGEYEKTEFTKFSIVSGQDTFCVENPNIWVEQQSIPPPNPIYLKPKKMIT
ncbi:MAG TPA: hypothetical protein PKC58_15275, partial [Ignavibacteria bacterium]|nr:hypothetical protein [Ignavibacteria bacterium]